MKLKLLPKIGLLSLILALTGCAAMKPTKVNPLQANAPYIVDMDASRRAIDILPRTDGKGVTVCAEPSPDVALQITNSIMAQAALQNPSVSVDVQTQFSTAVVQLANRTETVVLLREAMYRLCEQSVNENLNSDQTMQLYELVMQTTLKLAEADLAKSNADIAKSFENPDVRAMWEKSFGHDPEGVVPPAGNSPTTGTGAGAGSGTNKNLNKNLTQPPSSTKQ